MNPRLLGHLRTVATLAVLGVLLLVGVAWGLSAVSEPFPETADPPICVDSPVSEGDVLRPGGVTVSVLNAGERSGLASTTLDDLVDREFAKGQLNNASDEDVRSAQIWSADGSTAAVRLVRSYLGGKVEVVEREGPAAGITVVVGDQFPGVKKGRGQVKVDADGTVCSPPGL